MMHCSEKQHGLTLPELLVSLTVVATLTASAASGLVHMVQENRMVVEVNRFLTALHLARSTAVKQGVRVVLCPSADGEHCGSSVDWVKGWLLFASEDRERDADEPLIQRGAPMQEGIDMRSGNRRKRIVYRMDGSAGGTNSSFTFCDRRGRVQPRVICLSNAGRPRLTRTRCNGKPVDCTPR